MSELVSLILETQLFIGIIEERNFKFEIKNTKK